MNEIPCLMTFDEWAKLPAEDRHRYNLLVQEIQQLQGENAKLRAEIVALEGVAEIMDCGHERRFSTLQIGATGNETTCALCENARLKSQIVHMDQLRLKEVAESEYEMLRTEYNLFRHTAKAEIEQLRAAGKAVLPYIWDDACFDGETAYQRAMVSFRETLNGGDK